jgi:hypothetical protein
MMGAMKALGREEYDHSGILTILDDLAGKKVTGSRQAPFKG